MSRFRMCARSRWRPVTVARVVPTGGPGFDRGIKRDEAPAQHAPRSTVPRRSISGRLPARAGAGWAR